MRQWLLVSPEGDTWEGTDPWTLVSQADPIEAPSVPGNSAVHRDWKDREASRLQVRRLRTEKSTL